MSVLIERAKHSFNQACSGELRGRESFSALLSAMSDLRLAGFDPEAEKGYAALGTTHDRFFDLLRSEYRRAARENYEDSTEANFKNANRPPYEAISDLHLVPAYMALGGLDPAKEESWQEIGVNHDDYNRLQRLYRVAEAKRCFDMAQEPNRGKTCRAMEDALYYMKQAGCDLSDEQTYQALGTTKAEFETLLEEKRQLTGYRPRNCQL